MRRGGAARYQLVTRPGCHLCDQMAEMLDAVLPPLGLGWEAVMVDDDAALRERYGEVVPVLLRDGVAVAKVRLERRQLERIVRGRR